MNGDITRSTFRPGKHYSSVRMQQGRVQLDADWNEAMDIIAHRGEAGIVDLIGRWGGPVDRCAFGVEIPEAGDGLTAGDFWLSAGHYYVDGILCENEQRVSYRALPDRLAMNPPAKPGYHLVYLDVWQRPITDLEDPDIRETALGGATTATRTKTVWQVGVAEVPAAEMAQEDATRLSVWPQLTRATTGRLAARGAPGHLEGDPGVIPTSSGYRRLENRLYRVEIHASGNLGQALFKWSRDNGSVAVRVEEVLSKNSFRISESAHAAGGLEPGKWLELLNEPDEVINRAGHLMKIDKREGNVLYVSGQKDLTQYKGDPTVLRARCWDFVGTAAPLVEVPAQNDGFLRLEGGVEVKFSSGWYRAGDFWLIPARSILGDVEWPQDDGSPALQLPHGVAHHFAPLALVEAAGTGTALKLTLVRDYRVQFPPLSELLKVLYVLRHRREVTTHVTNVRVMDKDGGTVLGRNSSVGLHQFFYNPFQIDFDRNISALVARDPDAVVVTVDLPYPLNNFFYDPSASTGLPASTTLPEWFTQSPVVTGYQTTQIASYFQVSGPLITLQRYAATYLWLGGVMTAMKNLNWPVRLRARLTLRSHLIWSDSDPPAYLDGDAFAYDRTDGEFHRNFWLPSGDRQRGGDFQVGFWLVDDRPPIN